MRCARAHRLKSEVGGQRIEDQIDLTGWADERLDLTRDNHSSKAAERSTKSGDFSLVPRYAANEQVDVLRRQRCTLKYGSCRPYNDGVEL